MQEGEIEMLQWKRDLVISVVVLIFSIFNFIYAAKMNTDVIEFELAKPGNYVRLWLVLFSILAIILLIRSLRNKSESVAAPIWHKAAVITVIETVVYLLLLPYIGFYIMTVLYLAGLGLVYTHYMRVKILKGKTLVKEAIKWVLFSILVTIILYFVFAELLSVILPEFSLF